MSDKNTPTSSTQGARSPMELVLEFHRTYSVPIRSFDDPTLSYERRGLRARLVAEEFAELMGAVYGKRASATSSRLRMPLPTSSTSSTAWQSSPALTSILCSTRSMPRTFPNSCPTVPSSCARTERSSRVPTSLCPISPAASVWRQGRTLATRTKVPSTRIRARQVTQ